MEEGPGVENQVSSGRRRPMLTTYAHLLDASFTILTSHPPHAISIGSDMGRMPSCSSVSARTRLSSPDRPRPHGHLAPREPGRRTQGALYSGIGYIDSFKLIYSAINPVRRAISSPRSASRSHDVGAGRNLGRTALAPPCRFTPTFLPPLTTPYTTTQLNIMVSSDFDIVQVPQSC